MGTWPYLINYIDQLIGPARFQTCNTGICRMGFGLSSDSTRAHPWLGVLWISSRIKGYFFLQGQNMEKYAYIAEMYWMCFFLSYTPHLSDKYDFVRNYNFLNSINYPACSPRPVKCSDCVHWLDFLSAAIHNSIWKVHMDTAFHGSNKATSKIWTFLAGHNIP